MVESINVTTNMWSQYFMADSTRDWILILMYGGRALLALLALLFNLGVVYITIKNSCFHNICNVLIAMESLFAIFQDANYFVSFVVVTSGVKFIRLSACFPILIPLALGGESAQVTMLCTGCDRLYKCRNPRKYMLFIGTIIFLYTCYMAILYYVDFMDNKNFLLSCSTHELPSGTGSNLRKTNSIVLSVMLMIIYFLVWFVVFYSKNSSESNKNNRRLIKSLIVIIGFNLFGVFIKNIVQLWSTTLEVFPKTGINFSFSLLTIAVYGANAPVLFVMSNEYRSKFHKHFKFIQRITFNRFPLESTQVVSIINGRAHTQIAPLSSRGRETNQIRQQSTISSRGTDMRISTERNM